MSESVWITALLLGFFGSVHCVPMCGGIAGILSQAAGQTRTQKQLVISLGYNAGRISSYTIMGLLAGSVGQLLAQSLSGHDLLPFSRYLTAGFMIAFGLYLMGWQNILAGLEKLGHRLWKRIEPYGRRVLPVDSLSKAYRFGLIWGWLPCGLVYSTLAWALASGDVLQGGLLMLCFGLGTLPMLLALGLASRKLAEFQRSIWVRRTAGGLIIAFALYHLSVPMDHSAHGPQPAGPGAHDAHQHMHH